ncbi:hypothetical protein R3P38DRAFT_3146975 [Favolaschia claudopus]|uniref:HMG box domain-containing protein n=1 Tax=Favolaschia claudopus TaxID=2862362 RepID=A0AAV9Z2L1_9AGAR
MPKSPFTRAQDDLIESFFPGFVKKLDEGVTGSQLTTWKQGTASDLLDHDAFKDLDTTKYNRKTWFEMIVRKFTNYRNQVYLKNKPVTEKTALSAKKANPMMKFSSIVSGRQLYARENTKSLNAAVVQRMQDTNNKSPAAVYQTVLKSKWDSLSDDEKEGWNARAEAEAGNIQQNQQEFPETISLALQDLCQGGLLGDAEIVLFYGFRDSQNHELISGSIHAHSKHNDKQFGVDQDVLQTEYEQAWWAFNDRVLPHSIKDSPLIPRNTAGHPVFPSISLEATPTADIRMLLVEYFEHCWVVRGLDSTVTMVPWDDIASHPEKFYDTDAFPIKLNHPQNLSTDQVHTLGSQLLKFSVIDSPNPFRFREPETPLPPNSELPSTPKPISRQKSPTPGPKSPVPPPSPKSPSPFNEQEKPKSVDKRKLEERDFEALSDLSDVDESPPQKKKRASKLNAFQVYCFIEVR